MRAWLPRLARATTVALCALCVVEIFTLIYMRNSGAIYRTAQRFPAPSGYKVDGGYLPEGPAACYVIRVTADNCPYCRQDRDRYVRLAEAASLKGCRVVEVAPRVGQIATTVSPVAVQLQFVNMRLGQALDPFATPQTILLDGEGRLTWERQGAMDEPALDAALKVLEERRQP